MGSESTKGLAKNPSPTFPKFLDATDDGYTKVCGKCAVRWEPIAELVGSTRDLEFSYCPACNEKAKRLGRSFFKDKYY